MNFILVVVFFIFFAFGIYVLYMCMFTYFDLPNIFASYFFIYQVIQKINLFKINILL